MLELPARSTNTRLQFSSGNLPPSSVFLRCLSARRLHTIPVSVPSELLERRPDIAAAERRVASANAQIGVAKSAYYPIVNLGASGGFESTSITTLIQGPSGLWSVGLVCYGNNLRRGKTPRCL